MRVDSLMHAGAALPAVAPDAAMADVIHEITDKRLGMTCVVNAATGRLEGVVTDGDLRRHMTPGSNLLEKRAAEIMTTRPVTIGPGILAVEALRLLEEKKITSLVVVERGPGARVVGVVHLHDLWRTQMI
jgi:arabinose-5-phosphate isomerase